MTPEQWERIEGLYHAAYLRPPDERAAYLVEACPDDDALRRQVQALLNDTGSADRFPAEPVPNPSVPLTPGHAPVRLSGRMLGAYRLHTLLGAGGMGEVYRAHDTKLGRDVAIKVLPHEFTSDPGRLSRFEREARMLAAINHPNICGIYGLEEAEGIRFIVLELVEGETLATGLPEELRGRSAALPVNRALSMARQIAEALEAAHDRGIVHRDLKPANIKITPDGLVKVLDFGLAKALAGENRPSNAQSHGETREGVVVGTAAYMSPEQARGLPVDRRTDIWAFGVVLFEMLAGHRPFRGETVTDTLASILTAEPGWDELPAEVTPGLARLLRRSLQKDPRRRLQSIGDARVQIEDLLGEAQEDGVGNGVSDSWRIGPPAVRRIHRTVVAWAAVVLATLTVGMLVAPLVVRQPASPPFSFPAVPPPGASLATEESPVISPDGLRLAFVGYDTTGRQLIYISTIGTVDPAKSLPSTDGASLPFWSPDSRRIGFFAQGMLKTVDISTGPPRTLAKAGGARGGTWNEEGVIVFVPSPPDGPYRVSANGEAEAMPVPSAGGRSAGGWFPSFLPDGRHFLEFVPTVNQPENAGIWVVALESGARTRLVDSQSNAIYAAPGYLLFWREGTLRAQSFDPKTHAVEGSPVAVASGVGLNPVTNQALFSVSTSGALAYFAGAVGQSELVWFGRDGNEIGKPGATGVINTISLSPDAASVVYDLADPRTATFDLWQLVFGRPEAHKLTFNPANDLFPVWSHTGERIAFSSLRERPPQLYEMSAKAAGNETLLFKSKLPTVPSGWSADGQVLFYTLTDPKTRSGDIWALPLGSRVPHPVVNSASDDRYGMPSPDGRWLAYVSNESGTYEVYVQAFPGPGVRRQVSTAGGSQPQWRRDGKELFYMAPDRTLMVVDFESFPETFTFKPAERLFTTRTKWLEIQGTARTYAAAPDGQRFLVANATEESQSATITVVLNWVAGFAR